MYCPSSRPSLQDDAPSIDPSAVESAVEAESPYDPSFWKSYLANSLVMVAIAVLFRYADFVTFLGGSELHLGWIVGVGMVGSLAMRAFLGVGIDRYGARLVWLSALALFAASCFGHIVVGRYDGPAIYLLRIAYCSALAGIFGSSMTFISGRAPVVRMAEMLGMLGTSGFLGMVLGAQLGDLLLKGDPLQRWHVDRMFLVAGTLSLLALAAAWWATRDYVAPSRRKRPPMAWLVRRYFPGSVLLVSVVMGFGFGLPATYLPTYAATLGIPRIGLFFAVYAATAIATRVLTRRLPERLGMQPMIFLGLALLVLSQMLFLLVRTEWHLLIPSISYGISHAILFPTAVAEGCGTFPSRYRGLATTLMLAAYDVGQLIGAPTAGLIVHLSGAAGLASYPAMFLAVAALFAGVSAVYVLTRRKGEARKPAPPAAVATPMLPAAAQEPWPRPSVTSTPIVDSSQSTVAAPHGSPPAARSPAASEPA